MENNKSLYIFLAKGVIIYLLWIALYPNYISPIIDVPLSQSLSDVTVTMLNFFGIDAFATVPYGGQFERNPTAVSALWVNDLPTVTVANECNGLELMALFVGFIVAYSGDWRVKILYMLVGLLAIYSINIIRIHLLVANSIYSKETLDFNHHYTFTIAVYACVFGMWMLWVNRFSKLKLNSKNGRNIFVSTK